MVVDVSANGIPGALVSWTPLQPEWIDGEVTWSDQNWQEVEATTVLTTAGPDGRYELPALPAGALAELSAVWATKPGFVAEAVVLDSTSSDRHLDIVLEPAEALEVVVLSGLGACVEGATVEYAADYDRDARGPEADPLERRAQLILRRTPVTGAEGIVMLPSYPDHFVVQARKDGMISDVLSRTEERRLTLSLKGTFSVRGSVRFAPGVSSEIPLHVDCRALEGSRLHRLARVPVDGEGRWSMHSIPLLVIDSYVFRLAAEGVALDEEHTGIPSAGDVVEVELEAWPGEAFAVAVPVFAPVVVQVVALKLKESERRVFGRRVPASAAEERVRDRGRLVDEPNASVSRAHEVAEGLALEPPPLPIEQVPARAGHGHDRVERLVVPLGELAPVLDSPEPFA